MEFEIEGIKENWLLLQKEEMGADFQSNFKKHYSLEVGIKIKVM